MIARRRSAMGNRKHFLGWLRPIYKQNAEIVTRLVCFAQNRILSADSDRHGWPLLIQLPIIISCLADFDWRWLELHFGRSGEYLHRNYALTN